MIPLNVLSLMSFWDAVEPLLDNHSKKHKISQIYSFSNFYFTTFNYRTYAFVTML